MAHDDEIDQDLLEKYKVHPNTDLSAFLAVDGVPKVPSAKVERLQNVLKTIFSNVGKLKEDSMYFPLDSNGNTKGFIFLEYEDAEEAARARKGLHNYQLDKVHVFSAYALTDIFDYASAEDEWKAPVKEEYQERENLRDWLLDPSARDQFVTRVADQTEILWNSSRELETVYNRQNWTDTIVQWSPKGSYLTTFHKQGIALWGGRAWSKIVRFPHSSVRLIEFSPNESYLITWSREPLKHEHDGKNAILWDVRTGKALRAFDAAENTWPTFKWSPDDQFVGRIGEDVISIYKTPDMGLLDKKSIVAESVRDFSWSPSQNIIAFWTPEQGNTPARVTLMEIPTRTILRTKNLFGVHDCKFYWQSEGDYLIVKVDRYTKTKKSVFTNLELFRMKEKEIPVEVLELKDESITKFAWEPKGNLFVTFQGEQTNVQINFYSVEKGIKQTKTIEKKALNQIYWSPRGQHVLFAGFGAPMNGSLEFWNARDGELMASQEHFLCTDIEWDPTGRFLTTFVSAWKSNAEAGYKIWDFRGKLIHDPKVIPGFGQALWRPRPPTLLSKEKMKEIKKNLSKYSAEFTKQDEAKDSRVSDATREKRRAIMQDWNDFISLVHAEFDKQKELREDLRGYASDEEGATETIEEIVEEVLEETKTQLR